MTRPILTARALVALTFLHAPMLAAQPAPVPQSGLEAAAAAAATITASDLRHRIGVIAHDSMRGRDTPSPGLEQTAAWIASEFGRFGLRPAGDEGSFLQRYPLRTLALDAAASSARFGNAELRFGRDVAPAYPYVLPDEPLAGSLVVVSGTGITSPALTEAALSGKHVLIVPPARGDTRNPAVGALVRAVLAGEPLAVWLASDLSDSDWASRANGELRRLHQVIGEVQTLAALVVRDRMIEPVLSGAGLQLSALRARAGLAIRVEEVGSVPVSLSASVRLTAESFAPNVVGILPGSDPVLRDQWVVFSAHMDHVGVGASNASEDSIYNGADDDASGTATVVELAEAFASLEIRPRRSLIFLTVSGEEKGLWGSDWFAEHPPVPVQQMVANVNIDMVGRNWTDTIVAIGREHSDLGATLARVNAAHPELGMTAINDLWPQESFYTRSDHYNFARRGVPVLFFFNGTHEDYHEPSDEVDKIDAEKTARIGRLLFYLGLEVANRTDPPVWDPDSYRRIVGRQPTPGGRS